VITQEASAKINLFLHVGDKRADGFHPLQSLAVFTGMGDVLTMEPAWTARATIWCCARRANLGTKARRCA
jgi:4-diphosphocytidyl-2-C-methyl-D-erythritol kinase